MQKMLLNFIMVMGMFLSFSVNSQELIKGGYTDPQGAVKINPSCNANDRGKSADVQGLGNKILDVAGTSKYWIEYSNPETKRERAYSITRASLSDEIYTGSKVDIQGLSFFYLDVYIDGFHAYRQVTAYMESCYVGAIYFDKWSRDEQHNYAYNMDVDENNHLRIINTDKEVTSLTPSDTIMKEISIKERNKKFVF